MFEFVHVQPESQTTLSRMALTLKNAGYSSLVVRNHSQDFVDDPETEVEIDVFPGVEIRADTVNELHGRIGKYNDKKVSFVCVHGGDPSINRTAVSSRHVDILCHPRRGKGRSFNHVLAREAAENDVAVEFNLSNVLRSTGGERVNQLRDIREMVELVRKYDTPYVISTDPFSHLDVRGVREIRAVCELIGFEKEEIKDGIETTPKEIAADTQLPIRVVDEPEDETDSESDNEEGKLDDNPDHKGDQT